MVCHVCPWWGGDFIDNPLRRLFHDPQKIIGPCVRLGMSVMDVSCGMGWSSIPMAKMLSYQGQVIAVGPAADARRATAASGEGWRRRSTKRPSTTLCVRDHSVAMVASYRVAARAPPEPLRMSSATRSAVGCVLS